MSIKKISKFIFHPTTVKIVALIGIVGFFFIHPAYAADTTNTSLANIQKGLNTFISLCSRLWVILAILAGKLMTNDFVYGAFLHMDVYLRKIRNIMKNFANFALAALVLRSIIKNMIGKEAMNIKDIITKTLIAGILIQASRFLMGAVIDISTVATAGISSFPMAFLKNDVELQTEIKDSITKFKSDRIIFNQNATGTNMVKTIPDLNTNTQSSEELRKNIVPSYNSVSGPFIYLGMGVFKFQNYLSTATTTDVATLTLGFALRFVMIFFFTIGLLLLLLANIMRIGFLRIFIIGSPFLILIQVFKPKAGDGGIFKLFSLSNLLAIVFKPVIFVIGISLMLIVIASVQYGMMSSGAQRENNLNGVTLGLTGANKDTSTLTVEGITNISVNQTDLLGKTDISKTGESVKNIFSEIIMLLLSLFLMRRFVKLSLTTGGEGPIEKTMKGLLDHAENIAKSAPILPFKGTKASFNSIKGFGEQQTKKMAAGLQMNADGSFKSDAQFKAFLDNKILGLKPAWSQEDKELLGSLTKSDTFMSKSIEMAGDRAQGLSLGVSEFKDNLEIWLQSEAGRKAMNGTKLVTGFEYKGDFEKTFKDNLKNRAALHMLMGGNAAQTSGTKATNEKDISYDNLLNNTYYKTAKE